MYFGLSLPWKNEYYSKWWQSHCIAMILASCSLSTDIYLAFYELGIVIYYIGKPLQTIITQTWELLFHFLVKYRAIHCNREENECGSFSRRKDVHHFGKSLAITLESSYKWRLVNEAINALILMNFLWTFCWKTLHVILSPKWSLFPLHS